MTTPLDHSSTAALLADLDKHRDSLFRFDYDGIVTSQLWHLRSASLETGAAAQGILIGGVVSGIRIRIAYAFGRGSRGTTDAPFFVLVRGRLVLGSKEFGIVVVDRMPLCGSFFDSDDSQQRLNDNLRGVFA